MNVDSDYDLLDSVTRLVLAQVREPAGRHVAASREKT